MKRIVLNATLLDASATFRSAGVSQYLRRTLRGLARAAAQHGEWDLQALVTDPGDPIPGIRYLPIKAAQGGSSPRVIWEQTGLPLALNRIRPDLFHGMVNVLPTLSSCPRVVTVLDLSFERTPDSVPFLRRQYLQTMARRSVAAAQHVVAISQATADDLIQLYGVSAERITVIPVPVDPSLGPGDPGTDQEVLAQLGLSFPYFLHVGTIEPRKNLGWLVNTFTQWQSEFTAGLAGSVEVRLVLAGARGWESQAFFDRLQAEELRSKVTSLGYVPPEQLGALYRAALGCLFPSRLEGFGMPILESMACGTPVLCSDIPAFREIARDHALFFNTESPNQIQSLLTHLAQNHSVREHLSATGLPHAARFSEVATGKALLRVYQDVL